MEARLRRQRYGGKVTEARLLGYVGKGTEARFWRQGYGNWDQGGGTLKEKAR